ncbi:hypothetical protein BS78_05G256500 [Paspalum vaginatum]|nr:hypothetical protein BS78_05G256500 [Paspalum vaginatum]
MPSPNYYSHHHVVVAAVLWFCTAPPGTAVRATTGTAPGVVGRPPSLHNSSDDGSGCLRRCGDVHIPYPFGAGPADSCSVSPELRLHCNHTAGNGGGVHKLFVKGSWWNGTDVNIEVVDIDVIQGQMRVVSPIFYSCFINHNTTSEGRSQRYILPEPYRFSSARNEFKVLGGVTATYMLGYDFNDDDDEILKHPTNGSCTGICCCQSTIQQQGDEGLRYYYATFDNRVNYTEFSTTYPCAHAVLMDSSYGFNFSTSYLVPNNEFNKSRVPVVLDWEWVIPNQTCQDAHTQPAGYACVSDHSKCVDASRRRRRGYLCQCAEGFQGNPYVKQGCKGTSSLSHHSISLYVCLCASTYIHI